MLVVVVLFASFIFFESKNPHNPALPFMPPKRRKAAVPQLCGIIEKSRQNKRQINRLFPADLIANLAL